MSINWNHMIKYHLSIVDVVFPRKPEILQKYEDDIKNNICSHNLNKIKKELEYFDYVITINQYPYNFTSNLKHYIFWFNNICSMNNALSICKKELGDNIIIFCNTFNLKSVKDINHYHIILQN